MTRHIRHITAHMPIGNDDLGLTVPVEIHFHYTPGRPATGPTYDCGGEPAEGPELELIECTPETTTRFMPGALHEAAQTWAEWFLTTDEGVELIERELS